MRQPKVRGYAIAEYWLLNTGAFLGEIVPRCATPLYLRLYYLYLCCFISALLAAILSREDVLCQFHSQGP
jgi:hypothetical protein